MPRVPRALATAAAFAALVALAGCVPSEPPPFSPPPTTEPRPTQQPLTLESFLAGYGSPETLVLTGTGPLAVDIPEGAQQALVTATHPGAGEFVVRLLDDDGEVAGYPLVETTGPYTGATAMGISAPTAATPTTLDVVATGAWEVTLAPLGDAPRLTLPVSGTGDAVFVVDGQSLTGSTAEIEYLVDHLGTGTIAITQHLGPNRRELLVNEMGEVQLEILMAGGPSLLEIRATGPWSLTEL